MCRVWSSCNFNPRTRTGCDFRQDSRAGEYRDFNPRTRTGCDSSLSRLALSCKYFNPRTRTGCDSGVRMLDNMSPISIHAPARGATSGIPHSTHFLLFQSTHPHGVRRSSQRPPCRHQYFNPRTRTGCDFSRHDYPITSYSFQSTHPHGVRLF